MEQLIRVLLWIRCPQGHHLPVGLTPQQANGRFPAAPAFPAGRSSPEAICLIIPDECLEMGLHWEDVAGYRLAARFATRKRVLDGATGPGHGEVILAQAGAVEYVGIETDPTGRGRCA